MITIYLITGTSGEHSDRSDWNVKAFVEKPAAERFLAQLHEACADVQHLTYRAKHTPQVQALHNLDVKWTWLYDVPDYEIEEIELVEAEVEPPKEDPGRLFKPYRPLDGLCSETCVWGDRGSRCLQPEGHNCIAPIAMVYARRDPT